MEHFLEVASNLIIFCYVSTILQIDIANYRRKVIIAD